MENQQDCSLRLADWNSDFVEFPHWVNRLSVEGAKGGGLEPSCVGSSLPGGSVSNCPVSNKELSCCSVFNVQSFKTQSIGVHIADSHQHYQKFVKLNWLAEREHFRKL